VIGLHPGTRAWSTVPGPDIVPVPDLAGALSTRDVDLARAASDFGHHVHRRPLAVAYPASAADVAAIVRFGRRCGLAVVPRGQGHSVDGQAQVLDGIVIDMSALARIHEVGPDRISVDAGARWSAVVDAALPGGVAPPVLGDYLELSVGGTLSVGGIGGASHRHGCQADNVYDLDVVTPGGYLLSCSRTRNSDLFDAVRGGQGEHGIITRATVALAPAHSTARRYQLPYTDLGTFLADQRRLVDDLRFDHIGGQAQHVDGRWRFLLEAVTTYTPPDEPDERALLSDLAYHRGAEEVDTTGYRDFLYRLAPAEAQLRALGAWDHPHPRCNLLLPGGHAEMIISGVLGDLAPEDIGVGGGVLIYPIPTARLAAPNMPRALDRLTVVFGLQRTAPPHDPGTLDRMRTANAALHAMARRFGGASYAYPTARHDARLAMLGQLGRAS
jgi:hypothetical protein